MAECNGCQISIGGIPHYHIGAALVQSNGLWAQQDIDSPVASIALVIRCQDGMPALVIPRGVPPEAAMPVLDALRRYESEEMAPSVAKAMYEIAKEGFKAAHHCGALVRDFRGNWHFSGAIGVKKHRKVAPDHG